MATKKSKKTKKTATKKLVKKSAKKAVKKTTAKATKKPAKKTTKKASKNVTKKPALKPVVKAVKLVSPAKVDYSKAVTPLGDRLVVKVVNSERVTAGGLIIPDSASMASGYLKAKVLAVGHGAKNKKGSLMPLDVKVGDTVLFSEYAGTKVNFNSEELQIIHESDVMGIVE